MGRVRPAGLNVTDLSDQGAGTGYEGWYGRTMAQTQHGRQKTWETKTETMFDSRTTRRCHIQMNTEESFDKIRLSRSINYLGGVARFESADNIFSFFENRDIFCELKNSIRHSSGKDIFGSRSQ